MNYTNHSNRLRLDRGSSQPANNAPTFLSLEHGRGGLCLRVRTAATLARRKRSAFKLAAASLAIACALLGRTASAQQFVIQPTDESTSKDTKIYNSTPTMNFSSNLSVTSQDTGAHFLSLVQFDLSTVTASSASISNASLTLFCTGLGASGAAAVGGTVVLQPILNAWRENAADTTPAGAPLANYNAFFATPVTITTGGVVASQNVTAGGFITWDLTNTVKSWLNGSLANNGVLISLSTTGGDVGFADVDSNGAINAPRLTVNVPEPSTTAAMAAGLVLLSIVVLRRQATT